MISPKTKSEKLGLTLMVLGFLILIVAGTVLVFQSRGTIAMGSVGRPLLIIGLGTYIMGRLLFWQGRRGRK